MYSTGTEFYKLIGEAQRRRESVNTAAETAGQVKDMIESWTPFKVKRISLKHGEELTIVARATKHNRGNDNEDRTGVATQKAVRA